TTDVADAVTDHRHHICLKFRHENGRLRLLRFRFDQRVCPVECISKRLRGIQLNTKTSSIARTVSLMHRASKRFFNQLTVPGPELLTAGDKTARGIVGFVISGEYVFGKVPERARVRDDHRRSETLELMVILVESRGRQT